ncbi:UNVERIFIED_CONTAM: hypothetical protein Sindi_1278400 [Sesamum indicum]
MASDDVDDDGGCGEEGSHDISDEQGLFPSEHEANPAEFEKTLSSIVDLAGEKDCSSSTNVNEGIRNDKAVALDTGLAANLALRKLGFAARFEMGEGEMSLTIQTTMAGDSHTIQMTMADDSDDDGTRFPRNSDSTLKLAVDCTPTTTTGGVSTTVAEDLVRRHKLGFGVAPSTGFHGGDEDISFNLPEFLKFEHTAIEAGDKQALEALRELKSKWIAQFGERAMTHCFPPSMAKPATPYPPRILLPAIRNILQPIWREKWTENIAGMKDRSETLQKIDSGQSVGFRPVSDRTVAGQLTTATKITEMQSVAAYLDSIGDLATGKLDVASRDDRL